MKTHDNRALFSKALLKARNLSFPYCGCRDESLYLHLPGQSRIYEKWKLQQQTVTVSGVVKDKKGNLSLVPISWKKERPTVPLPILTVNIR